MEYNSIFNRYRNTQETINKSEADCTWAESEEMSLATLEYMARHNLSTESSTISNKILDIEKIQSMPKLK
jgi:hypothetical protein